MDGRKPNQLTPSDRLLRTICVLTFIPGIAFLVATGAGRRGNLWAFVGIAPLALSSLLGALVVSIGPRYPVVLFLVDLLLAGFTLGIDIWGWVIGWRGGMIGGHAASALLVQFFIHSFFVLRTLYVTDIRDVLSSGNPFTSRKSCTKCPHCQSEARSKKTMVQAVGGKESYHRVPGREDEYDEVDDADVGPAYQDARPSTDDETARLV